MVRQGYDVYESCSVDITEFGNDSVASLDKDTTYSVLMWTYSGEAWTEDSKFGFYNNCGI